MKPSILLVDDEPRFLDGLEQILNHYGYSCTKAYTGTEGIGLLKTQSFDLALLDVKLPDISGCDIAGFIKSSCDQTTAIMLTGVKTVENAVQAMRLGAYDFLSKPLNHQTLLKTLKQALQHNRLKKELASSEQKFQLLAEAAWEGIVILEEGKVIEANEPFLEMFGYTLENITGGLQLNNVFSQSAQAWQRRCQEESAKDTWTIIGKNKDGTEIPVEVKKRSITFHGRHLQILVVRDLTERIKAEKKNLDLQKKLAEANKLNALGLMAGSVAHDLNNILTGIVSYPELLLQQMDESDTQYKQIRKIQEAGKRAAAVVSDLLAITRGGSQQKIVENVNTIVLDYLNSLEHAERLTHYRNATVQTTLQEGVCNVCCSPQQLHKVLLNLVGNALEAVQEHGMVHILTENCKVVHPLRSRRVGRNSSEYIKLTVADDGAGIDEKDIDKIFDPFYSTKVMGKSGTGLGLSIVWNIVQDHDGWIEVKNSCPGSIFEVYLPVTQNEVCRMDSSERVIIEWRGERILIVDDQEEQIEFLENALTDLGYSTFSVTSGEAAIEFLKSEPVDLLLVDMVLGNGLNGRETLEVILNNNPGQKVIVVSGFAEMEEIEKTKSLGVSQFINKPVNLSTIDNAIQQLLSG